MSHNNKQLNEGLRTNDLKDMVSEIFTVDQYKSKMGEDKDIVVLGFRVEDKHPAIDLMEFIERGYKFILDADMSSGEEHDGKYQVFVELERTPNLPKQVSSLIEGISQLCDCWDWKFKYHYNKEVLPFTEETLLSHVPVNELAYQDKMNKLKETSVKEFFDQGATEVTLDENNIVVSKPYSGPISLELISMGHYDDVKDQLPGALQLDEASQSQVSFLEKYLGNYEINRIDSKFLIRNGTKGMIVKKDRW
jgi:hypothetical protein